MKHNIIYVFGLLAMILAAGCSDELYREVTSDGYIYSSRPIALSVNPENVVFSAGSVKTTSEGPVVTATDLWKASGVNTGWVTTFAPMTGGEGSTSLDIRVAPKTDPESRVNIVNLSLDRNDAFTTALTITQNGQPYEFKIKEYDEAARTFPAAGATRTFDIDTNIPAGNPVTSTVTTSSSPQDCVVEVTPDYKLKLTLKPTTVPTLRSFTVNLVTVINGREIQSPITVRQEGFSVTGTINSVTLPAAGGSSGCKFTNNIPCTLYKDADWIRISTATLSPGSTTVTISADANTTAASRSGKVYVVRDGVAGVSANSLHTITVTQAAADVSGGTSMTFTAGGGTLSEVLHNNVACDVVAEASWLSVSPASCQPGDNTLYVTAAPNPYLVDRTSTVSVYPATGARTPLHRITVTQRAITGGVTENVFAGLSARGEKVTVDFTCEAAWTATPSATFVSVSPAAGEAGNTKVEITVAPNTSVSQRSAEVRFFTLSGGQIGKTVYLYQHGASTTVKPASLLFVSKGATLGVEVDTDVEITAIETPEWIEASPTSLAQGTSALSLTASRNAAVTGRSGRVVLRSADGMERAAISVTQEASGLTDDSEVVLSWKSQIFEIPVNVTENWTALPSSTGWLRLGATSGSPADNLILLVDENTSEQSREGGVRVTSGGISSEIRVIQQGQYIHVDGSSATLPITASSLEISVSSTVGSSVSAIRYLDDSRDWLSLDGQQSADGVETYSFSATENDCAFTRRAEIVFEPADKTGAVDHPGIIYTVSQLGRTLSLSQSAVYANATGGQSEFIVISAVGPYEVTVAEPASWFTLNHTGNVFYLDILPNDSGAPRSGSVTVSLTDLPEGQQLSVVLGVYQSNQNIDIAVEPFKPNVDYK